MFQASAGPLVICIKKIVRTEMAKGLVKGWAITHWDKGIYIDTVRATRKESIKAFEENYATQPRETYSKGNPNYAIKIVVLYRGE